MYEQQPRVALRAKLPTMTSDASAHIYGKLELKERGVRDRHQSQRKYQVSKATTPKMKQKSASMQLPNHKHRSALLHRRPSPFAQRHLYEQLGITQAACLCATQAHAWEDPGTAQCPIETIVQHSHGGEFCIPIILTLSLALILPALSLLYLHVTVEGSTSRAALKYQAF